MLVEFIKVGLFIRGFVLRLFKNFQYSFWRLACIFRSLASLALLYLVMYLFNVFLYIFEARCNAILLYMDIYHTKKQTENTPRSCSYLLLKTLFYFIPQCTSVPYLLSGLCKLGKELDNCNFTFI